MKAFTHYLPHPTGCWIWVGSRNGAGYGNGITAFGDESTAHRQSWALFNGPIPHGSMILHKCGRATCVNPDHLYLGTHLDNAKDRRIHNGGKYHLTEWHREGL
jgi:hypothetical protein